MGARASRPHPFAHPVISLKIDRAPTIPTAPHRHSGEGRNPEGRGEGALRFHPLMWPSQGHSDSGEELAPYPDTRPESRGARRRDIPPITKITVQTTPFAPLSVLRGQSPSFQPPTRHSGGGRNPEGRGRGESHQSQKSQFRQLPSRPFPVIPTAHPFVDNPRHSVDNRHSPTPVIPAKAGIQRGGDVGNPTNHKKQITVQTTPFALRARHSNRPPVIPAAAGIQRGGALRDIPPITKIVFRQPPSRPLVSFVDNPRHSNRPPVIPAAAGIQRGGDVGNPTNHKNHTNHSSDNPLRAPSRVLRGQSPSFQPPTRHSGGGRNPTPFAPLSVLRGQSPSFQPPTRGIQRGGTCGTSH